MQNSTITQLEIAEKYNLSKDYITDINLGRNHFNANLQYPLRRRTKHYCVDCGVEVAKGVTRCSSCQSKNRQKVDRPDVETLIQEIAESSFLAVGKKYGVSDNAVRKWCKSYNIPHTKKEIVALYQKTCHKHFEF